MPDQSDQSVLRGPTSELSKPRRPCPSRPSEVSKSELSDQPDPCALSDQSALHAVRAVRPSETSGQFRAVRACSPQTKSEASDEFELSDQSVLRRSGRLTGPSRPICPSCPTSPICPLICPIICPHRRQMSGPLISARGTVKKGTNGPNERAFSGVLISARGTVKKGRNGPRSLPSPILTANEAGLSGELISAQGTVKREPHW